MTLRAVQNFAAGPGICEIIVAMIGVALRAGSWALVLTVICACSPQPRGIRPNDTQVVAQWLLTSSPSSIVDAAELGIRNLQTEEAIGNACSNVCFGDGNDMGGGAFNVYLYTRDVPATVRLLERLEKSGNIPDGLRIGVAHYKDKSRRDWSYVGVFPRGLKVFNLTYK